MRRCLILFSLIATVLAGYVIGCYQRRGDISVTSLSPKGDITDDLQTIRISFDKPVVPEEKVGEDLKSRPFYRITPGLETAAHFQDRQTLVIKPQESMAPATKYTVEIVEPFAERLKEPVSFSFVHLPLEIKGLFGVDHEMTSTTPDFALAFNQPMEGGQIAGHCEVASKDGSHAPEIVVSDPAIRGTRIPFTTREALKKGASYTLKCEGFLPTGSTEAQKGVFTETFKVHPMISLTSFKPSGSEVTPDDLEMVIAFSTPVSEKELESHIRIVPEEAQFKKSWYPKNRTVFVQHINLKASTDYKITVKKGLEDELGQALEKDEVFRFTTTDAAPNLRMETGIFAVEAEGDGYPVWSRNVQEIKLHCADVPKKKVVQLLTSDMNYDPWYSAGSSNLDWQALSLKEKKNVLPIEEAKNKWQLTNVDLPARCGKTPKRGLYLAEFRSDEVEKMRAERSGRYPYRLLGNVTDLGVLLKVGPASGLVWVTSIATGEPVQGAAVTLYDLKGKKIHHGVTDSRGVVMTPGSTTLLKQPGAGDKDPFEEDDYYYDYDYYRCQRLIAMVEKADDFAVVDGNWANGIQIWNFGVSSDRMSGETRIRGFIQSDRGVYRPGETVHFKGIVREVAIGKPPTVPQGAKVKIHVEDVTGASVLEKVTRLSEFGGFHFDLPLGEEASLGDYYVNATVKKQTFRETFSVEEFRPVAFEIKEDNQKQVQVGDKITLTFDAQYLFGAPVKEADVSWNVSKQRHHVRFKQFGAYTFSDFADSDYWYPWYEDYDQGYDQFVADGEDKTNKRGRVRFTVKDKEAAREYPERYNVTTSITDATSQTVTKRIAIFAHHSDFYLGLHAQEWVQAVDMPFAVNAVAVTPDGEQTAADVTLTLSKRWWKCEHKGTYRTYTDCQREERKVWERPIEIPSNTNATEKITPKEPGEYTIRIEAKDSRGKSVSASTSVWVIGRGEAFWSGDESARMSLIASKDEYRPGETATLVPRADTEGSTMLVTLERNGVLEAFIKKNEASGGGIEIPLNDAHAPNVYASVAMVKGRKGEGDRHRPTFKLGIVDLKVSADKQRLRVRIETEKIDHEPGEQVKGKIVVTAADGAPVKAEVSLSAADEGILQLIDYKTPDPMSSFYKSWGLGVDNSTNWNRIARLNDPSGIDDEEGADGQGGDEERIRSRFVSSAYWAPALITDENGEIPFEFEAPDNLTAFRLMAVAADKGNRFGSGESRVRINKKLLAKPVLPRFLGEGDKTTVGVLVHNYTDADGEVEVTAELEGLWVRDKVKTAKVKKGESARVNYFAKVGKRKEAVVRFQVKMGQYFDGFEKRLPVRRPLTVERVTAGEGKSAGAEVALAWPDDLIPKESDVEVVVDRTGLSSLEGSLRYLIQYPYGCLEQTLSGLVPLLKVRDLARSLKLESLKGPKLETYIRLGVAKVLRHQHYDGHFSLWPGSRTEPHLTAYALWGLSEAKRAGVRLKKGAVNRGLDALSKWVSSVDRKDVPEGGEGATMAMAAFVLADNGRPDTALNARLYEARAALPTYGKAFLLRALHLSNALPEQVEMIKSELLAKVEEKENQATVKEAGAHLHRYMSSDVRTTAIVLGALIEVDSGLPIIDKLVSGLKGRRLTGGRWGNTQENVYALVALAEYAREQAEGAVNVTMALDGEKLTQKMLKGGTVMRWKKSLRRLKPGTLSITSDVPVCYRVAVKQVREADESAAVDKGFGVSREVLDFETEQPVTKAKVGQLIKVRVKVSTPSDRHFVALVDPIPAGCEAVNSRFATEIAVSDKETSYGWDHQELHDDRVMAFADQMPAGTYTLTYLMRATVSGTFTASPGHVEEMYTPTVFGRSPSIELVVR